MHSYDWLQLGASVSASVRACLLAWFARSSTCNCSRRKNTKPTLSRVCGLSCLSMSLGQSKQGRSGSRLPLLAGRQAGRQAGSWRVGTSPRVCSG